MNPDPKATGTDRNVWRLFIAMSLPGEVRHRIDELQRELKTTFGGDGVRWVGQTQFHLTLRFLGDLPSAAVPALQSALDVALVGSPELSLHLAGLGCFPDLRRPRVLWAGIHGDVDALRDLQQSVAKITAPWGETEERKFQPHLTLARIREGARFDVREWQRLEREFAQRRFGHWRVAEIQLVRSELKPEGAVYSTLGTFTLGTKVPFTEF